LLHQVLSHHFLLTKLASGYPPIRLEVQSNVHYCSIETGRVSARKDAEVFGNADQSESWIVRNDLGGTNARALPTTRASFNISWRTNLDSGSCGD
jgi:hypothetical protein